MRQLYWLHVADSWLHMVETHLDLLGKRRMFEVYQGGSCDSGTAVLWGWGFSVSTPILSPMKNT